MQIPWHLFPSWAIYCLCCCLAQATYTKVRHPPTAPRPVATQKHKHYAIKVYFIELPTHYISKTLELLKPCIFIGWSSNKQAAPKRLIPANTLCCSLFNVAGSHSSSSQGPHGLMVLDTWAVPRNFPGSPASVALLWQLNMLDDTAMVQSPKGRGCRWRGKSKETQRRHWSGWYQVFWVSFLALFSKERVPWRSARCHTGILGCFLQRCVAAFPAPHGGGPVSQGTPTGCANIPPLGNMLSYWTCLQLL